MAKAICIKTRVSPRPVGTYPLCLQVVPIPSDEQGLDVGRLQVRVRRVVMGSGGIGLTTHIHKPHGAWRMAQGTAGVARGCTGMHASGVGTSLGRAIARMQGGRVLQLNRCTGPQHTGTWRGTRLAAGVAGGEP